MPIQFRCDNCNAVLRVPDNAAGKHVRCPKCGKVAEVAVPITIQRSVADRPPNPLSAGSVENSASERSALPPQRPVANAKTALATSVSPRILKFVASGFLLAAIGAASFWIGRVFPSIASDPSGNTVSMISTKVSEPENLKTVKLAGTAAEQLEQIAGLEPMYAFGDDIEPESQPDDGNRLQMPRFDNVDVGEPGGYSMSGNPQSEFKSVLKAQYALRVEERRSGRYRAVALLGIKPTENSARQGRVLKIMAITPPLTAQHNNVGWVFRHLDLETTLTTDDGTIIKHPDMEELESVKQRIVSGQASPADVLNSLRKMRYPDSRKAVFIAIAGDRNLSVAQREMCLRLLACPVVCALFFDADVGPGGTSSSSVFGTEIRSFAVADLPPNLADLVVDAIIVETNTFSILSRRLHEQVFGPETADRVAGPSGDVLPETANEALSAVWENASTDALLRLMVAMNGQNRSAQLRRLLHDRQLTQSQITSFINVDSSAEELTALLGKVPISTIIEILFSSKDVFGPLMHFIKLAKDPMLSTHDANELAKACVRFKESYEVHSALHELEDKADVDHYVLALALCGEASDLESKARELSDPVERERALDLAANELKNGRPGADVLLVLAGYGTVANILAAVEKTPKGTDLSQVVQKLSSRPDLTAADQQAIREFAQRN